MTREAATDFYRRHYRRVFNISLRIVRDSADAEEIMQDTMLKFLRSAPSGLDEAQVSAWLARTAIRKSLDALRSRKRRLWEAIPDGEDLTEETTYERNGADGWPADSGDGRHGADDRSAEPDFPDMERIREAIDSLPEGSRLILTLVLIEGLDYQEIAAYTGTKETTLRSQYSRGIAKLRKMLGR